MLVVPNVMGICIYSPPLDSNDNSKRGVQFCKVCDIDNIPNREKMNLATWNLSESKNMALCVYNVYQTYMILRTWEQLYIDKKIWKWGQFKRWGLLESRWYLNLPTLVIKSTHEYMRQTCSTSPAMYRLGRQVGVPLWFTQTLPLNHIVPI